jgi:glycine/D-amino acid oxidase-like deaminating enzyme
VAGGRVVVVGGGVIGTACAYYLTRAGAAVALLEAGAMGSGTSSRCDGNVLAIDKNPGFDARITLLSQELLHELGGVLGDMEYRRPGSYLVCDGEDEVEPARRWVDENRASGVPTVFLDREAVHKSLPELAPDIPAGLYCASDSTLNPLLYVARLAEWAREHGATLRPYARVDHLVTEDGRVAGVELQGGERVRADAVVVATGVWTPPLLAPLGLDLPIRPRKGTLLVSARGPRFGDAKVMEFGYLMNKFGQARRATPEMERYGVALVYEPTTSGNFLLGSSREFVGEDTAARVEVAQAIARRALRFYPGMAASTIIRAYAGIRPWTPDHLPVVSGAKEWPGLFVAAGHEGDGIGLAAVTGALITDLVLGREPRIEVEPLDLGRFAHGGHAA